ncbi:Spindle and kinetochore-associated protein 3 [Fukomys damarensis]|uniref:Spindle and kinetochore-associated protein 3 n=2 Tax=Fukomys damarensis TaxID=885580 RepID=A0A091DG13_FUKDA|nr:Spindle and kinetochore-associated protein 3 [Fukomys damarensis]
MDLIRVFCGKLWFLASTLDHETTRLQQVLEGDDSEFEDDPMRILHDLQVWALKDDVNALLDKARSESQESIDFIKATKLLMKKNSMDIIKIREFFQKYGYNPRVKENSVCEQEIVDSTPEMASCDHVQKPHGKDELPDPSAPVSEEPLRSPQLADFGMERYMIPQVLPNPPQAISNHKEDPITETPPTRQSVVKILKTLKCALKMDDFECVTPKLEHFGIPEYTTCLNEDYTIGLKNMKTIKSEVAVETEFMTSDNSFAAAGPIIQQLAKGESNYTDSPLTPTFCTPGLKVPSAKKNTALVSTNYPL